MRRLILTALFWASSGLYAELVTVAAYNVENYLVTNRMVEGVYREDYPKPEREKAAVTAVIKAANPDVPIVLKGDQATQYSKIMAVLDLCRQLDLSKVGLVTGKPTDISPCAKLVPIAIPSGRLCREMANTNSQMRPTRSWPTPKGPDSRC